jgi:23S rRNA (cytidine1920-2'-O)/16S rRNA (cytidine1409-2'-O)-methyltransferase
MNKERLDILVYNKGLAESREKASRLILAGLVSIDKKKETKPGMRFNIDSLVEVQKNNSYVSRGGLKIESAYRKFKIDFSNKIIVDVGASTGGFVDFSLRHGAKKVYAVDTGYGQLAQKLREDKRVINLERTDFRKIESFEEEIDLFVIDVSFISVKKILFKIKELIAKYNKKIEVIALVKPQFEVGKEIADRYKGIIKDEKIQKDIFKKIVDYSEKEGFAVVSQVKAGVKGVKGNQEYFLYLRAPKKIITFGVFDIFHSGHKYFLGKIDNKKNLTIVVTPDEKVLKLKGCEPQVPIAKRMEKLEELGYKTEVELDDPWDNLIRLGADLIVMGYDQEWSQEIKKNVKSSGYLIKIKKIKTAYKPAIYKTSLLKNKE